MFESTITITTTYVCNFWGCLGVFGVESVFFGRYVFFGMFGCVWG